VEGKSVRIKGCELVGREIDMNAILMLFRPWLLQDVLQKVRLNFKCASGKD